MSYIKISDPAIIDLAGVQQIINVVNQHSDYLNGLINRFGPETTPDWEGDSTESQFDAATASITYGKITIKSNDNDTTPGGKTYYKQAVTFGSGITFSKPPFITLTLDNSGGSESGQMDFILSVHNVSTSGFTIRAIRSGFYNNKETIDNNIRVNYIATGPR
jgi:hypothetical protein